MARARESSSDTKTTLMRVGSVSPALRRSASSCDKSTVLILSAAATRDGGASMVSSAPRTVGMSTERQEQHASNRD